VCSDACFEKWVHRSLAEGYTPAPWGPSWSIQGTVLDGDFATRALRIAEAHRVDLRLRYARNLLEAERSEDAAQVYDGLGMWKEAGEARRHGKKNVVTQVQVDVNSLIDQVRRGGLTTTYACPACRSPIRIDADMDVRALTRCQYCGTAIQSTDLVEFLSRVVGYR
jgi:DNA-directed RNA polymerase subunit RPC12/RpoP